nr:hypothetical protein [Thecaphora frezii]
MRSTLLALTFFLSALTWGVPVKADSAKTRSAHALADGAKCTFKYSGTHVDPPPKCTKTGDSNGSKEFQCPGLDSLSLCSYCQKIGGSFFEPAGTQLPKYHGDYYYCQNP